ncbi:MAG: thioesterase family protein [Polyangiaceae bacterium]
MAADDALSQGTNLTVSELRVRFFETDLMGIVHHATHLTYFEAGRVEWLRRRGVTYAEWAARGMHLPVVEVGLRYRSPARFDDVLTVETRLTELRTVSLRFDYRLLRGSDLLAEGFTKLASIDESHTLRRFPEDVLAILRSGELAAGP